MGPIVLFGIPVAAIALVFTLGMRARRRAERRATLADSLALAVRRGIPLDVPLDRAAAFACPKRATALRGVVHDLRSGRRLAGSLRTHLKREFPEAVAQSIDAGEQASRLAEALESTAAEASRTLADGHRMALATFYPALLFVGVAMLNLLLFEGRLRSIIECGEGVTTGAPSIWPVVAVRYALVALAAAFVGVMLLRRVLSPVRGAASARFLRTTALLLEAGRPIHTAISSAATTAGARRLEGAAFRAAKRIEGGYAVSDSWRSLPIGRAAIERLASASKPGLPSLLEEVASGCEARDSRRADRWIRWSVPIATAAAGLLVAIDYAILTRTWVHFAEFARPW